jgi:hypothetical protein
LRCRSASIIPGAHLLYERLGYASVGRQADAWDEQGSDGAISRFHTMCTVMR